MQNQNSQPTHNASANLPASIEPFKPSLMRFFSLRPYGDANLTPKVYNWIIASSVVILFMALLEGLVWGLISRYLAPDAAAAWKGFIAIIAFIFIFGIIWVTDTSLVMYQRKSNQDVRAFWKGIISRAVIIFFSLFITAPFLNLVIRDNDIQQERKAEGARKIINSTDDLLVKIEEKRKILDDKAKLDINKTVAQTAQMAQKNTQRQLQNIKIETLKSQLNRAETTFKKASAKLKGFGKRNKKNAKGYDKAYRDKSVALQEITKLQPSLTRELKSSSDISTPVDEEQDIEKINTQEQTKPKISYDKLDEEKLELDAKLKKLEGDVQKLSVADFENEYPGLMPDDSLGNRKYLLKNIQIEEEKKGIQWWESVETLAQALLGLLFFSLLAIKLLEPDEVGLYLNEDLQEAWKRYVAGQLDHLPHFSPLDGPRMAYRDFAKQYQAYDRVADPDHYWEVYNRKLIRQYQIEELRTELELKRSDQTDRSKRTEVHLEDLRSRLEQERTFIETEKQQMFANAKRESELHLAQLRQEFMDKQAALEQQKQQDSKRLEQEIKERNAQIETDSKRLDAERLQAQQDAELRKQRLQDELALEWQKLQAVADELAANRQHQMKLADYAMQRQKMADSIQAIQDEISRIEADKEKLDAEIARYDQALQDEHENAKWLGEQIFKAKEEPKNREAELAEMQRRLKRAQEAAQNRIDEGADDEIIARANANTKKLSEEVKKLKQQQNESVDKLAEPTRKLAENQSRIAELESKKSSIKDKQRLVEIELEQWREKRRDLI